MAGISTGVFKKLFVKRQTGLGVIAPPGAAGSARSMRRVTSTLDLTKATFQSAEVLESQQVRDMRHGVRAVSGTLSGELSVGGYQQPMESVLRQSVVAGGATAALATIATAAVGMFGATMTRGGGSFLADGHKIGDIVSFTGYTAPALSNNTHYAVVVSLDALNMGVVALDKQPFIAKAAGDNVAVSMVGKKTFIPVTGQTRDYYTIEHWFGDVGESEVFADAVFTGFNVGIPPSGMATIEFPIMGINMQTAQAQYFTAPAASATGAILAAANGVLIIQGAVAGLVTGITLSVNGQYAYPTGDGIVGSNVRPDILPGVLTATGQITVLFSSGYFRDLFLNEVEASLISVLTADNSAAPQFTAFNISRMKFSGSTKDDTTTGLTLTMPFTALENVKTSGALQPNLQTTISVQDSAFI